MSLFYYALLYVHFSFAIILKRKRKLFALLLLSYRCEVTINVLWLFLTVGWSAVCDYSGLFRGRNSCRCAAWSWQNFSPYIDIVLMFSYSGPPEILGSDGEQNID